MQKAFFKTDKVRAYQALIRAEFSVQFAQQIKVARESLLELPVQVGLVFVYARPKQAKRQIMMSRPDLDNLEKIYLDALNGLAYKDDAFIVYVMKSKLYGDADYVWVTIHWIEEEGEWERIPTTIGIQGMR